MKKKCVIGLVYLVLPLSAAFATKYEVVGFDINKLRGEELNNNFDRRLELSIEHFIKGKVSIKYSSNLED